MAIDLTLDEAPAPRGPPPAFIDLTDDVPPPASKRKRQEIQLSDDDALPAAGGAGAGRVDEAQALRARAQAAEASLARAQAELKSAREDKAALTRLQSQLATLRAEKAALEKESKLECFICFEPYADSAGPYTTTCGHHAHKSCLDAWFKARHECPKCNTPLAGALKYFRVYLR